MTVTFLDPEAEQGIEVEPYELFADTNGPLNLALIANSFPDGTRFMDKLADALGDLLPQATLHRYQKANVLPITDEQFTAITEDCDAVISVWGQ